MTTEEKLWRTAEAARTYIIETFRAPNNQDADTLAAAATELVHATLDLPWHERLNLTTSDPTGTIP